MLTLFILRHAKSSHDEGVSDKDRTLNERGRSDAKRMGELARRHGLLPDRVLSSSAARARETSELFAKGAELEGAIDYLDSLYLAEPGGYVDALVAQGETTARVMLVGHNPGLEGLVLELTGEREDLPTAALVETTLPIEAWSELTLGTEGRLRSIFRPKDVD